VIVFSKSTVANRSLTEQFTRREVRKVYVLVTDRKLPQLPLTIQGSLVRSGEKYISQKTIPKGDLAETRFYAPANVETKNFIVSSPLALRPSPLNVVSAEPLTGRTHQIRVHAAEKGFPILGDTLYGGTPATRVFLHAAELTLDHPATCEAMTFRAPPKFETDTRFRLREALIESDQTNAFRL